MRSLRLAISLLLVPRLFVSLVLFPLLIGIAALYGQFLVTQSFVRRAERGAEEVAQQARALSQKNIIRFFLFGRLEPLPAPVVCRWIPGKEGSGFLEVPPSSECAPDRLDVALRVWPERVQDADRFVELFTGNVERIHLCSSCTPDLVVDLRGRAPETELRSLWGLGLLSLVRFDGRLALQQAEVVKNLERTIDAFGRLTLDLAGLESPIVLTAVAKRLALVVNVAAIIIAGLWLAFRAHRRVLDFFARNGALLPMVAAIGKNEFYTALWFVTLVRVGAFLLAAVPIVIVALIAVISATGEQGIEGYRLLWWAIALTSGVACTTLLGSIADLQHRRAMSSVVYRWVPMILSAIGLSIWLLTLFLEHPMAVVVRHAIAATPVVGLTPMLLAPIVAPPLDTFILHTVLALVIFAVAARRNVRWFAAHLEEL